MSELQSYVSVAETPAILSGRNHEMDLVSAEPSSRNNGFLYPCNEFSAPKVPLCFKDTEPDGASLDIVAELSAELERERQKNAELMEKICFLESQIQEREKASPSVPEQDAFCSSSTHRNSKLFKRQKTEARDEDARVIEAPPEMNPLKNHQSGDVAFNVLNQTDRIVNWMGMEETYFLNLDKNKEGESAVDCGDSDESDDDEYYDEEDSGMDDKERNGEDSSLVTSPPKHPLNLHQEFLVDGKNEDQRDHLPMDSCRVDITNIDRKDTVSIQRENSSLGMLMSSQENGDRRQGDGINCRKSPKVAFCPKEVRRIMESEELKLRNAQSHTIRKILVFAPLGIRHGCDDVYELDFNDFKILRKGEPYVSPKDPGEHVLYEHPGARRKIFYPNRQNPILCPVQILEEEKAMRPSGSSCPSYFFLCIKYGGRTRNLPQNEYVRQRMGRNKLKSFGPLVCKMALLVHIRSGSFFFKALGITLLFMAGFPDDLVRRETKYRNLDLLQKYYRSDEDAEGEELFHSCPTTCETISPIAQQPTGKPLTSPRSCGKKQTASTTKSQNPQSSSMATMTSAYTSPAQFALVGYVSVPTQSISTQPSVQSQTLTDPSPLISQAPLPYPMLPPYSANPFPPVPFWQRSNAFPSWPYPSSYGYRPLPPVINYLSPHSQPYYPTHSCYPLMPTAAEISEKRNRAVEEAEGNSDSSSSGTEEHVTPTNC
ncbi:hypothetical protein H6P81_006939 [Aristolochia fimbriata]|uniref:Uncharacterized protein n=1 Tax=Aristolochia fimbriata TaxID=158543 RepID=A0AAV7EYQ5_ARIFI|nr:hypothetical protein H6P81_006939 [Aristolochia fimbriata]